jgi:hypothetical protein
MSEPAAAGAVLHQETHSSNGGGEDASRQSLAAVPTVHTLDINTAPTTASQPRRSSLRSSLPKPERRRSIHWRDESASLELETTLENGASSATLANEIVITPGMEPSDAVAVDATGDSGPDAERTDDDEEEQKQRRCELRRRAKMERLQERRMRESERLFSYSRSQYPVREWQFRLPHDAISMLNASQGQTIALDLLVRPTHLRRVVVFVSSVCWYGAWWIVAMLGLNIETRVHK